MDKNEETVTIEVVPSREGEGETLNERTPPFNFRFDSRRLKEAMLRRAERNHRTLSGEINAICDEACAGEA
jgi:hypothetical protein